MNDINEEKMSNKTQESSNSNETINNNQKSDIKNCNYEKQGIGSKILNILLQIICLVLIVCIVIIAIRAMVYKKYDVFGYRFYIIMSGSMEPQINVLDGVITKECDEYKSGDIISFEVDGSTTMHRIVEVYTEDGQKLYLTQGDANNTVDKLSGEKLGRVQHSQVKGKAVIRIPQIGKLGLFLKANYMVILLLMVGIFIVIFTIKRLLQLEKETKEEK